MLWTGLMMAALLTVETSAVTQPATQGTTAPTPPRADRSQEVVCRTAPVTGSRFNQRRCRTREQEQASQREAQRWVGEALRGGPSTEAVATNPGPSTGPM